MSQIKEGSVVDVATGGGLRQAIVSTISGTEFSGYPVNPNKHYAIRGRPTTFLLDEVIAVYPDETAIVVEGQKSGFVLFKDEYGMYVGVHDDNGRVVKSIEGMLKVLLDFLDSFGEDETARDIRQRKEFYLNYLKLQFEE